MLKIVIIVILLVVVAVASLAAIMMWLVKSRHKDKKQPVAIDTPTTTTSGTCARCGEQRIIVSKEEGMCASCYSALRTKAP
jgi:predicted RNase H-like nuclease